MKIIPPKKVIALEIFALIFYLLWLVYLWNLIKDQHYSKVVLGEYNAVIQKNYFALISNILIPGIAVLFLFFIIFKSFRGLKYGTGLNTAIFLTACFSKLAMPPQLTAKQDLIDMTNGWPVAVSRILENIPFILIIISSLLFYIQLLSEHIKNRHSK